jgi:hypothetical protein
MRRICQIIEAVAIAVYIMNQTPTTTIHGTTPEKNFIGKKPNVSHLRVFGCISYVHVLMRRDQNQTQKLINVFSLDIPWNKKDIDASTLPLENPSE